MKKRILLILVVGVSFAPPVFASIDMSTYRPMVSYVGEQNESDINHVGVRCEAADLIRKEAEAEKQRSVGPSTAGGAFN